MLFRLRACQVVASDRVNRLPVVDVSHFLPWRKPPAAGALALIFFSMICVSSARASDCAVSDDAKVQVDAMLGAASRIDYRGTLLVEYGKDREFLGVNSTQAQGEASLVRLNKTTAQAFETVNLAPGQQNSACSLSAYYAFNVELSQPVAGRDTVRLAVRPRDTLRLGYVMDIDSETGVPLRVVTATPDGQVLERFEFAQFEILGPARLAVMEHPRARPPSFTFAALPPGFHVVAQGTEPTAHQVVSDGMASVSVFIEQQPQALAAGEGVALRGSTLAYTRGTPDHHLITVMGEVPITTARLLADAVRTSLE